MRVECSRRNLRTFNQQKSRLENTIAIDETWISFYRPPEKDQQKVWLKKGDRAPHVASPDRYSPKRMFIFAMTTQGIIGYQVMEEKEVVNGQKYLDFLKRIVNDWRKDGKSTLWLLDDNARPHRTAAIEKWMEEIKVERWLQPPYSPDMSPCDYGCFHQLKRAIGGVAYPDIGSLRKSIDEEVESNSH